MKTNTTHPGKLAVIPFLFATVAANATTWYVATTGNDAGPGTQAQPFRTIGRGISSAQNGDTVLVANGVYSGAGNWNLFFGGRNFTLRSQGGAANCIVDPGPSPDRAFELVNGETSNAVLDGFTIRNSPWRSAIRIASDATITRCIITHNQLGARIGPSGDIYGGGIQIGGGNPTISNCTFSDNRVLPDYAAELPGRGGAIAVQGGAPDIINCTFTHNMAGSIGMGGAVSVVGGSATITGCTIDGNEAASGGGGVYAAAGSVTLIGCTLSGNIADNSNTSPRGGGLLLEPGATGSIVNCLFTANQSVNEGGAIYAIGATLNILHSTITGNSAPSTGGIRSFNFFYQTSLVMTNSIVYGNPGGEIWGFTSVTVDYSDVNGGIGGTGNNSADPLFVEPSTGNYHLQASSPCRNAASAAVPNLPATDMDGAPRNLGGAPDMGAYESTAGLWFVDRTLGNDTTGTGSPISPFATVVRAISAASNGHMIYIKQGNYGTDRPRITKAVRVVNWGNTGLSRIGQP